MFISLSLQTLAQTPCVHAPFYGTKRAQTAHHAQQNMWRRVDKLDLQHLAEAWMNELRARPEPSETPAADAVVLMNFTAPAEQQWTFLLLAVEAAQADDELSPIAAGPFEHLLGWHGPAYIDAVEAAPQRSKIRTDDDLRLAIQNVRRCLAARTSNPGTSQIAATPSRTPAYRCRS
jgi:hypothetical protein